MENSLCQSTDLVLQLHIVKPVGSEMRLPPISTLFSRSVGPYSSLQLYGQRNLSVGLSEKNN